MVKTVEIVATDKGWHVTRKYCGRTNSTNFFSFVPAKPGPRAAKAARKAAEEARDKYVKEWVGE